MLQLILIYKLEQIEASNTKSQLKVQMATSYPPEVSYHAFWTEWPSVGSWRSHRDAAANNHHRAQGAQCVHPMTGTCSRWAERSLRGSLTKKWSHLASSCVEWIVCPPVRVMTLLIMVTADVMITYINCCLDFSLGINIKLTAIIVLVFKNFYSSPNDAYP